MKKINIDMVAIAIIGNNPNNINPKKTARHLIKIYGYEEAFKLASTKTRI